MWWAVFIRAIVAIRTSAAATTPDLREGRQDKRAIRDSHERPDSSLGLPSRATDRSGTESAVEFPFLLYTRFLSCQ